MSNRSFQKKQELIRECIITYNLEENPALNDNDLLNFEGFPNKSSKRLAVLILTYKREALNDELAKISSQSAGITRDLRNSGFIFRTEPGKNNFQFKNSNGNLCREIIGFSKPKVKAKGKAKELLDKSIAAAISAIEIYNKPDFNYREETFAILMINAWELLLKAKILSNNHNDISKIYVKDSKGVIKKNRAGNPMTIEIVKAVNLLFDNQEIDQFCKENILLLVEIRDNSIHYMNKDITIQKKVLEYGTASLQNFVTAIKDWFDEDLSKYNFYLMPVSFFNISDLNYQTKIKNNTELKNLIRYFVDVESQNASEDILSYNIALTLETKFVKSSGTDAIKFTYSNEPDAIRVDVVEEDILRKYPYDYKTLVKKLKTRYVDFKQDKKFHDLKRSYADESNNQRYCKMRYLDPSNKKSSKKDFFSSEIIKEFDKHYTKK